MYLNKIRKWQLFYRFIWNILIGKHKTIKEIQNIKSFKFTLSTSLIKRSSKIYKGPRNDTRALGGFRDLREEFISLLNSVNYTLIR